MNEWNEWNEAFLGFEVKFEEEEEEEKESLELRGRWERGVIWIYRRVSHFLKGADAGLFGNSVFLLR